MTRREPQNLFSGLSGGASLVECVEGAKVPQATAIFDVGNIPAAFPAVGLNASPARRAVFSRRAVHHILTVRNLAQIAPPIVGPVPVGMVNLMRPPSGLNGKRYSMSEQKGSYPERAHQIAIGGKGGERRLSGSHDRTPNAVIGQGRALLTQRFRPVFYGRFTLRSQAQLYGSAA